MKLRLFNDSVLRLLKRDIHNNIPKYQGDDDSWVEQYFPNKRDTFASTIEDTNVDLLLPPLDDRKKYDGENAKRIHQAFPSITPDIATDERLWATLCHRKFYSFMKARWPAVVIQKQQTEDNIVLQRYFFLRSTPRKSQEKNGLARLWLSAEMTYDSTRNDPYELTSIMLQNTNYVFHLFGRNFSSNRDILQGTLEAIMEIQKKTGKNVTSQTIREYGRRLNLIGGVSSLDIWSKYEATRTAYDFMKPLT